MRWIVGLTEYAGVTAYTGGIGTHYAALLPALARRGIDIDVVLFAPREPGAAPEGGVRIVGWHDLGWLPLPVQLVVRAILFRRYAAGRGRNGYDAVFLPEWGGVGSLLPAGATLVTNLATGIRLGDWIAGRRARDFPAALRLGRRLQDALETRQIRRSLGVVPISRAVLDWNARQIAALPPSRVVRNCVDLALVARHASEAPLPDGWPVPAGGHGGESGERDGRGEGDGRDGRSEGDGQDGRSEGDGRDGRSGGDGRATLREEDAGAGRGPVVLFVGRLERRKGVLPAMDAFAGVLARHPDARLVLAGAGGDARFEPTRADLLARVPEAGRGRVTFLGHAPGDRLAAAMAAADVVLCPSLWEGFGNVALEAMAAGTPLVVTRGSGYDDFCRDGVNALMVAPDAAAALATAVNRILADPDLAAGLRAGGRASLPRFEPDAVAADLARAVHDLLAAASPAPDPARSTGTTPDAEPAASMPDAKAPYQPPPRADRYRDLQPPTISSSFGTVTKSTTTAHWRYRP